jgi:endonuclease/exonuclease/phosphatase (EEP) superfamily protein YafD
VVLAALAATLQGCTGAVPLEAREPTPGAEHFTVMTYNVHRDRSDDASTLETVGAIGADIVCLQEITGAWVSALAARYADAYPYMLFAPKENAGGLAILSRFPVEDRGVLPVPGDWHPGWNVVVDTPAGRVQLLHVHLRSMFNGNSDWVSNYLNTHQDHIYEMELFWKTIVPELPTLVVGDFNESPRGEAVRWLEQRGFRNALPLFRPGQFTWRGRSVASGFDMTIDHIMFDDTFEPLRAWVEIRGRSDHYPVIAHLEVPGGRPPPR